MDRRSAESPGTWNSAGSTQRTMTARWKQELFLLRRLNRRPQKRSAGKLHVQEGISLPDYVKTTISLGPKFAVEKKSSLAELLSFVRNVSRAVPDSESERYCFKYFRYCYFCD
ncbi:hypothetical protein HPB52_000375 [Rhipicephalus sanguineus]|uniref:Uncharacterized protein n=1 Tax=Rhipicephalus sanguineus TaxID=34632 RepID=A0A9D4SX29_RHISA|nr:hypothetical protein HPB52_000375 [Rhipicephalus sanguineus]